MSSRIRHYRYRDSGPGEHPSMLFSVRLDVYDVRSGFIGAQLGLFRAPWIEEDDLDWARDMVSPVESSVIEEIPPIRDLEWPASGDQKISRFFSVNFRAKIWRNSDLGLYSESEESRVDFIRRCKGALLDERNGELFKIRDIFLRRFLEMEQRQLSELEDHEWDFESYETQRSQLKQVFLDIREGLSACFLREDFEPLGLEDLKWSETGIVENQERLDNIRDEFIAAYNEVNREFLNRASAVAEYEVPLSHSQIEILSRGILWE